MAVTSTGRYLQGRETGREQTRRLDHFLLRKRWNNLYIVSFLFLPAAQPSYLCPVDLHKLQHLCGFDVVERYKEVNCFYTYVSYVKYGILFSVTKPALYWQRHADVATSSRTSFWLDKTRKLAGGLWSIYATSRKEQYSIIFITMKNTLF